MSGKQGEWCMIGMYGWVAGVYEGECMGHCLEDALDLDEMPQFYEAWMGRNPFLSSTFAQFMA